ncbi:MAG: DRTGG domain-containing protein, partial [Syntrophales bacterium]|nr:DRTGG domain-containing protein [Syntrophales bacterium]
KKLLWDYDAALITSIFDLSRNPENMSIGFDHSKVRYKYDEKTITKKISEMTAPEEGEETHVFIEAAETLSYGAFAYLDALSLARYTGGKFIIVTGGDDETIMDDIYFLKKYITMEHIDFGGVIINKVPNPEEFKSKYSEILKDAGIHIIGILPYVDELMHLTVNNLVDRLFPRIIAGSSGLANSIKNIFIGTMSGKAALQNLHFVHGVEKLVITTGDRSDMIISALESDTSCILLTNDIMPDSNIISKASELGIPLLLVIEDTYRIAQLIEKMEALLTRGDTGKINALKKIVIENVDMETLDMGV